jgi:PilZ domain
VKSSVIRELRAVQRFEVSLPVTLNWRSPGAADRPQRAFTRDISTRGMFVLAGGELAEGEVLEFEIDLALDDSTPLVLVEGEGRVVRVERPQPSAESACGFAVHNLWFKLREPDFGEAIAREVSGRLAASPRAGANPAEPNRRARLHIVPQPPRTDFDEGKRK